MFSTIMKVTAIKIKYIRHYVENYNLIRAYLYQFVVLIAQNKKKIFYTFKINKEWAQQEVGLLETAVSLNPAYGINKKFYF